MAQLLLTSFLYTSPSAPELLLLQNLQLYSIALSGLRISLRTYARRAANKFVWASIDVTYAGDSTA